MKHHTPVEAWAGISLNGVDLQETLERMQKEIDELKAEVQSLKRRPTGFEKIG